MDTTSFLRQILTANTIEPVLAALLKDREDCPILKIRFYHYALKYGTLVSTESIGHQYEVASKFREGYINKQICESSLDSHDSFWCFHLEQPVALTRSTSASGQPLRIETHNGIHYPHLTVETDCPPPLSLEKCSTWIDFPLIVSGACIGKLSCDVDGFNLSAKQRDALDQFWYDALVAGPVLQLLSHRRYSISLLAWDPKRVANLFPKAVPHLEIIGVEEHVQAIRKLSDTDRDAFFEYCVKTLPAIPFKTKYASLFLRHTDSFGSSKLVLVRSSHPEATMREHSAYYRLDEDGLTPWVARKSVSIRQQDMAPKKLEQLAKAGGPTWANKIKDCDQSRTWLGVPLPDHSGRNLGVLRFTEKLSDEDNFTIFDERALDYLATETLGPKLDKVLQAELSANLMTRLQSIMQLVLRDSVARLDVPAELSTMLNEAFPPIVPGAQRCFFLTMNENEDAVGHAILGGELWKGNADQAARMAAAIAKVIKDCPALEFVVVHDFENANLHSEVSNTLPDVKSLLATKVAFQGVPYGVLCVFSNRLDLLSRAQGHMLALIGLQAGAIYAIRKLAPYSLAQRGLKHDYLALHNGLFRLLDTNGDSKGTLEDAMKLSEFSAMLINAYCQVFPTSPDHIQANASPASVAAMLRETVNAAQASLKTACPIDTRIEPPDLNVVVYEPFVCAILFNLLRNAQSAADVGDARVELSARVISDDWLEIRVKNNGKPMSSEQIAEAFNFDPINFLRLKQEDNLALIQSGLFLSTNLAKNYRLPDRRQGKLNPPTSGRMDGCEIILQIPVGNPTTNRNP